MKKRVYVSIRAFILRGDEILALQRNRGCNKFGGLWEIPGGKVEDGSTATENLHREIREETGLTITLVDEMYYKYCSLDDMGRTRIVLFGLGMVPPNSEVQLSVEHEGHVWASYPTLFDVVLPKEEWRKEVWQAAEAMRSRFEHFARR